MTEATVKEPDQDQEIEDAIDRALISLQAYDGGWNLAPAPGYTRRVLRELVDEVRR